MADMDQPSADRSGADTPPQEPAALAAEIERTREELASTLDAIADKVSPKRVAKRSTKKVADSVKETAAHAKESVVHAKDAITAADTTADTAADTTADTTADTAADTTAELKAETPDLAGRAKAAVSGPTPGGQPYVPSLSEPAGAKGLLTK